MNFRLLICLLLLNSLTVYATESTDFLVDLYSKEYSQNVKIKPYKEFKNPCEQKIGDNYISEIVYGQAKFKMKKVRTQKVSYICVMDENKQPFWGYVIPR